MHNHLMLISFSRQFAFVKTHKTAGTSLEIALSCICRPPDLRAPIFAPDELLLQDMGGLPATQSYRGTKLDPHMPASAMAEMIPDEWPQLFCFTVERHPYEKIVSAAYWHLGRRQLDPSRFPEMLDMAIADRMACDRDFYCIDGKIAVDRVFFHSELAQARAELGDRFGRKLPSLPRAKGQFRLDRRPAAEILSSAQKRQIRQDMAWEFERFGFEP